MTAGSAAPWLAAHVALASALVSAAVKLRRPAEAYDRAELAAAPQLEECGMVFVHQAFGLQPKLSLPVGLELKAGLAEAGATARVEGGGACNSSEITLAARLVSERVVVGLEPAPVAKACAWEIPLRAPRAGTYKLEVTLLWYHEGGTWGLDAAPHETCAPSSRTSGAPLSLPRSLQGRVPARGQAPFYTNIEQNGRWANWCTWCRHSFFADRFVLTPKGGEEEEARDTYGGPFQHKVEWVARGAAAPAGAQAYSCAGLKRERYLGGLSVSTDVVERGKCRKLSHVIGSPAQVIVSGSSSSSDVSGNSLLRDESKQCGAGLMSRGWWESAAAECEDTPDRLDKAKVPRSKWPLCAHRNDFRKTPPKEWPCTGEYPIDSYAELKVGCLDVNVWNGSQQNSVDSECSPQLCACPAASLEDPASRAEARANLQWRGEGGCSYREYGPAEVQKCIKGRKILWLKADVPPPIVWRDLEVRFGVNAKQLEENQLVSMPEHIGNNDVIVVETHGFFHAGLEGSEDQLKDRVREELLSKNYTKDPAKKGQLLFVLSQAHHEWDNDDGRATNSGGLSQPQQEAYQNAALAVLSDSAWTVVDTFSPTRARPTVRRASRVSWGASGDGAQFAGITVPFLHALCGGH